MKAKDKGIKVVRFINDVVNLATLIIIVLLLAFAGYALWDSSQIYREADKSYYAIYKPIPADHGKSFKELQALNAEVFAWLTIYGTNIDYPVTQGQDNMKYVTTNAEGLYSLTGSIFLDYRNSKDFSDFNSILYGHHMARKTMFGEIGDFVHRDVFDAHQYGNLFFGGEDHDIEFFAFIHTDAYNNTIFTPNVVGDEARQLYLDNLLSTATHTREINVSVNDRIVLLGTCSSTSTNGRDILVGRITDQALADTLPEAPASSETPGEIKGGIRLAIPILLPVMILKALFVILILFYLYILYRRYIAD